MDYSNLSREQLLQEIYSLQHKIEFLEKDPDQLLNSNKILAGNFQPEPFYYSTDAAITGAGNADSAFEFTRIVGSSSPEFSNEVQEVLKQSSRPFFVSMKLLQEKAALLDASGEGIYGVDLKGNCTFINRAAAEMLGYVPAELIGQQMHSLIHHHRVDGSYYDIANCQIYQAMRNGREIRVEDELVWRKDSTYIPVEYTSSPVMEEGIVSGAVVTLKDISERKRAEQIQTALLSQLETERSRLEQILRQMPIGIIIVDAATSHLMLANEQVGTILREPEFTNDTLNRYRYTNCFNMDGQMTSSQELPLTRTLLFGETVQRKEFRVIRGDGSIGYVSVSSAPVYNSYGTIVAGVLSLYDNTEIRKEEERRFLLAETSRILASSLNFEITLDQVANLIVPSIADWCSIYLVSPEGDDIQALTVAHADPQKVRWAKKFYEQHSPTSNSNSRFMQVFRTGKAALLPLITEDLLLAAAKSEEELEILRQVGFTSVMIVPLLARGRTQGVITFVGAESGKQFDQEDLKLAEELASRAAMAIDNALLYREAQKAIETQKELDSLKDLFLSITSHELRAPLTSIQGYAQLVERSVGKELNRLNQTGGSETERYASLLSKNQHSIEIILRQSHRMTSLINQLLDYSRIQNQKLELNKSKINLVEGVRRVIEQQPDPNSHILSIETCASEIYAFFDEGRFEQVLNNLIGNAAKYSPPQSPIKVGIEQNPENFEVVIWVQDKGIGISREDQDRLFDRFYRVRSGENTSVEGLGLGLYIVREIVRQHGGRLWVESEPGTGSTFFFSIPLSPDSP